MTALPQFLPGFPSLAEVQARLAEARKALATERAEESKIQRTCARVYRNSAECTAPQQFVTAIAAEHGSRSLATLRESIAALVDIEAGLAQLEILATIRHKKAQADDATRSGEHQKSQQLRAEIAAAYNAHRDLIALAEAECIAP